MNSVTIDQGVLFGGENITNNGFQYIEFLQIPYAKPPLRDLRFKAPEPPNSWRGERDASNVNQEHIAFQTGTIDKNIKGSEDCLYLNVYTPRIKNMAHLLPVMVYIHGGCFNFGTGILKDEGGPDYLIENGVVVVAINYRLGVFGFLSLDVPEAAGNMGLKDQVMALQWIQKNIHKFGGDKNNVTLFGISAGSASIEYHIISPLSRGLFHKAILQSGSTINHWAINYNIKDLSMKLVRGLGYSGAFNDTHVLNQFLINQSSHSIQQAYIKYGHYSKFIGTNFGFVPSIEKDFGNGESFITEHPYDVLQSGKINKVDIISGFSKYEGLLVKAIKYFDLENLYTNKMFTAFWIYNMSLDDQHYFNKKFQQLYLNDNELDKEEGAIKFFNDFDFISGIWTAAKLMSQRGLKVYEYMFSYDGNSNYYKLLYNVSHEGPCHADDTAYTLSVNLTPFNISYIESDMLITKRISKMWTDFAKTGNPTPSTSELIPVQWPRFNSNTKQYLVIDRELEVQSDYQSDTMHIFHEIYKKYHK